MTAEMGRNLATTFELYIKESNKGLPKHLWFMRRSYILLLSKNHEAADDTLIMAYIF
jgi:hypothetical protein